MTPVISDSKQNTRRKMADLNSDMESKHTLNIDECFEAAREVATQAGKVGTDG